jgi:cbb3-type cytochrome oxidase subunit 3
MKIIYQFLETDNGYNLFPVFSTIMLMIAFFGIIFFAMKISKKFVNEMSNLPLDEEDKN